MNEVVIDDSQREMCAVLVMRTMLTDYCNDFHTGRIHYYEQKLPKELCPFFSVRS